jgi:hypothetical protein
MMDKVQTLIRLRGALLNGLTSPELQSLGVGQVIGGNNANFVMVRIRRYSFAGHTFPALIACFIYLGADIVASDRRTRQRPRPEHL